MLPAFFIFKNIVYCSSISQKIPNTHEMRVMHAQKTVTILFS